MSRKKNSLRKCLWEIYRCEPHSLRMAMGLGITEAMIPLGGALLSALLVDGVTAAGAEQAAGALTSGVSKTLTQGKGLTAGLGNVLAPGGAYGRLAAAALAGVAALFVLNALRGWLYRCSLPHSEYCNDLMEWKFDEKNMGMDYAQLDSAEAAGIRAKIQNDYDWGCGAYYMIPQFQRCCTGFAGILFSAVLLLFVLTEGGFWKHWSTLLFFGYVLTVTCICVTAEQRLNRAREALKADYDRLSGRSNWLMRGGLTYREGKDIRIYEAQPLIKSALREKERDRMAEQESRMEQRAGLWDGAASGILMGGAYLFIVLKALSGALSAGSVVLFASAVYRFAENLKLFSRGRSEIWMNARRMESSLAYLELPEVMEKGEKPVRLGNGTGVIEFRDVSFQYSGSRREALSHVSFRLRPGKRTAVVGLNGSGKTTLIKLLCRLYDPAKGQILLDGVDIRKYDYAEYLRLFSVVFQDFKLLSFSLGENVAASREYDADRARECLVKAGFGNRLERMPDGVETSLCRDIDEEGVEVSGGEAQKIAMARALYKDAPFVVLDEPTAALDPISEYEVYSGFQRLIGEKTAVFISHRLSSCRFCDEILVFHEGKLLQKGTHEELLADAEGQYYRMWQAQAKYYEETGGEGIWN